MKALILIVEDDLHIRRFLRATLAAEGFQYYEADTAEDGIAQANARRPDLLLLDLGLPDRDGLEVIRHVRESSQMPIVVLSARGQEKDKVAALDLGADDYVEKPFGVGELLARVRAALRRSAGTPSGAVFRFGYVDLDLTVSSRGTVEDVSVLAATPPDVFEKSALAAVRKWKYDPRFVDGLPTNTHVKVHLEFGPGK